MLSKFSSLPVCICGPRLNLNNSVSGLSLALETMLQGLKNKSLSFYFVDSSPFEREFKSGEFTIIRSFETICVICKVFINLFKCRIYYSPISTSSFGFIRDYITVLFAKFLNRHVVMHLHGGGFEEFYKSSSFILKLLIKNHYHRVDKIIVLGNLLKSQFYCIGVPIKSKLYVVPNGLTIDVDEPKPICRSLPVNGKINILYMSSLMESKGFLYAILAIKILEEKFPGRYLLHLCGNFVDAITENKRIIYNKESLLSFLTLNKLEKCVSYHGQISYREKEKQFINAHIFLLPTFYSWEGQPLSIIEALSFSLPIISCKHRGIPELIRDGGNGFFVKAMCEDSIAVAVEKISSDNNYYSMMCRNSRLHYENSFKRDLHIENLTDTIFENIVF